MRYHGVLVLSDLSLPSTAPPLAAVAFRLDRAAGIAQLAGIGVRMQLRRQGLGRRLLTGAASSLLASAGFVAERDTAPTDPANGRSRLVLVLKGAIASCRARTEQRLTSAQSDRVGPVHLGDDGQDARVAHPRQTWPGLSPPSWHAGSRATT